MFPFIAPSIPIARAMNQETIAMSRTLRSIREQRRSSVTQYKGNVAAWLACYDRDDPDREVFVLEYTRKNRITHRQRQNAIRITKRLTSRQGRLRLARELRAEVASDGGTDALPDPGSHDEPG